jgi:hypothetical protein
MMPTIEPYVPAIIRKVPETMMKTLHVTIKYHRMFRSSFQWSYSHIQPIGWRERKVPKRAPMRETKPPKTGIPLATT